jgi:hypothetical protein
MTRNAVWALSNLCRGKNPPPKFETVSPCLPVLARLLFHSDSDVLADACWALSYLSDGPNEKIQAVIDWSVCRRLVELLMHLNQSVVSAALRAVGNIVTGDDMQTQVILNCNALPCLLHLLSFNKDSIRKEACSTIFNITSGNRQQIQALINANIFSVMSNNSLLSSIIEYLSPQNNDLVLYAIRIIGNIVSWGESYAQIVIQAKALNKFSDLLTHQNAHIQREAVFTISNITAGNSDQIQSVIDANLVPLIVELFYFGDYKTQLEATYVMLNMSAIGSMSQLSYLINIDDTIPNMNIFDAMAVMLTSIDAKTVETALQVYNNLLVFSSKINVVIKVIKKCESSAAVYHIDSLQNHENSHVALLANHIMEDYFTQDLSIKEDLIFNAQLNIDGIDGIDGDKQMEFKFSF